MNGIPIQSDESRLPENGEVLSKDGYFPSKIKWIDLISLPSLLWVMLWLGINTGPWVFSEKPATLIDTLHYIRTAFPFLVLPVSILAVIAHRTQKIGQLNWPLRLWLIYGIAGLIACSFSPRAIHAAYWALCYLSVILFIIYFFGIDSASRYMLGLNHLSWFVVTVFLIILLYYAKEVLFVDYRYGITGYGIIGRLQSIADTAMSRSSGMARFAAIPGIVAFVFLFSGKGILRILFAGIFIGSASLIYLMQSRGAIISFAFSVILVMLLMGPKIRRIGAVLMIFLGITYYLDLIPEKRVEQVSRHIFRGQTEEQLKTLTGRTYAWKRALTKIKQSPILGWGPQADRYLIKEHVHNAYLYALLTSGIVGASAFIGGLVLSWVAVLRILKNGIADRLGQHVSFIQTAGILAFFTVRSIPEASGAMYGVDLMVMLPAIAYLGILDQEGRKILSERPAET